MFDIIPVIIVVTVAVSFWVGRKKGYSGILMALIAFIFPIMAVIVFFLPDRNEMKKNAELSRIREGAKSLELRAQQEVERMSSNELLEIGSRRLLNQQYDLALPNFLTAAERGNAQAQYACGLMYYKGIGCTADAEKALYWAEKAAEQGNADAQELCLNILLDGRVDASPEKIRYWTEKVAAQGNEDAKELLEAIDLLQKLQNNLSDIE